MLVGDARSFFEPGFEWSFLALFSSVGVALPLLQKTVEPYRQALRHFDSTEYDRELPPRMAQFRLDLRMITQRLARIIGNKVGNKAATCMMLGAWRLSIATADVMLTPAIFHIPSTPPIAIYFHRAMTLGLPTNMVVV